MEITIKIKTAEEFREEHAVIQINGEPMEGNRLAEQNGPISLVDVVTCQRERITELENQLAGAQHAREIQTRRVNELDADRQLHAQRAEENREWAEREAGRVAALGVELADAKKAVNWQAEKLGKIAGAVHGPPILRALRTTYDNADTRAMVTAIREIREALDSPGLPVRAGPTTSQA